MEGGTVSRGSLAACADCGHPANFHRLESDGLCFYIQSVPAPGEDMPAAPIGRCRCLGYANSGSGLVPRREGR